MRGWAALPTLAVLMLVNLGCQDRQALAELQQMKAVAEVERGNIARCERLFQEIDRGNTDFLMDFFAPDVQSYSPSGSAAPSSRDDLVGTTKAFLEGFPDLHHTIEEVLAEGDTVTVRFTARGTHEGAFAGIPATGREMALTAISMMRFEDGQVVEVRQEADTLGLMQQLGMRLAPAVEE